MKLKSVCKHCNQEFDLGDKPFGWMANHSRWCDENPKRKEYVSNSGNAVKAMIQAKKDGKPCNQFDKARQLGLEIPPGTMLGKPGSFKDKTHSETTKKIISEKALASDHRRLKKGTVWYKGVLLDSSWELAMAERLDELQIKWIRPDPIKWVDREGKTRHYFPDFYLPEQDLFLDPKNPQAYKVQKSKIDCLKKQLTNLIIISNIEDIKNWSLGTTGLAQSPSKR